MKAKYLILILLLSSCNNIHIDKKFYENNQIESISFFKSMSDTVPFKSINYYQNGEVKDTLYYNNEGLIEGSVFSNFPADGYYVKYNYKNNLRHGKAEVIYHDGSGEAIVYYKNDSLNCIEYRYDSDNNITNKFLWIDDDCTFYVDIIRLEIGDTTLNILDTYDGRTETLNIIQDSLLTLYEFHNLSLNPPQCIGSLIYRNGIIDKNLSGNSYHEINILSKTINYGEPLDVEIEGYFGGFRNRDDYFLVATIGELNSNLLFDKNSSSFEGKKGNPKLRFLITDYQKGYNLLLGYLDLRREKDSTLIKRTIIFDDFYVN